MSLQMSEADREAFLADLHVGVISIERADGPPLTVPIWYSYEPGGEVKVITDADSVKGKLLAAAGRFSLCAQTENPPFYAYVSVEGAITASRPADTEADTRPMAHRYFGQEMGDLYVEGTQGAQPTTITMQPERWWSVDYQNMT